jgi:hypothetical protein
VNSTLGFIANRIAGRLLQQAGAQVDPEVLASVRRQHDALNQAPGFFEAQPRIARKRGIRLPVTEVANEIRLDPRPRKELFVHTGIVKTRHGPAIQAERARQ